MGRTLHIRDVYSSDSKEDGSISKTQFSESNYNECQQLTSMFKLYYCCHLDSDMNYRDASQIISKINNLTRQLDLYETSDDDEEEGETERARESISQAIAVYAYVLTRN